ncbi:AMP-binding protein, partial [Sphingomonas sp.]|uniref:AMP-binding protein n=1 Tax=Sphingomonas sp. TaxID=28214 RepID=UPI002590D67A
MRTAAVETPKAIATPTEDTLARRFADFDTLGEALDYAASGQRGLNFHDARGSLTRPYRFAELRDDALAMARRLIAAGIEPAQRIAIVAETSPEFAALFFGVIYAGAWPVPLPLPTSFGGRDSYIEQLRVQLTSCDPVMLIYPPELSQMAGDAAGLAGVAGMDWSTFATRAAPDVALPQPRGDDIAYLQYSSGSTRFPHGVAITHRALLNNLAAHA